MAFFIKLEQLIFKIIRKQKKNTRYSQQFSLRTTTPEVSYSVSGFKLYYKVTVIKAVWYWPLAILLTSPITTL